MLSASQCTACCVYSHTRHVTTCAITMCTHAHIYTSTMYKNTYVECISMHGMLCV